MTTAVAEDWKELPLNPPRYNHPAELLQVPDPQELHTSIKILVLNCQILV
jgi:hypothetical protein